MKRIRAIGNALLQDGKIFIEGKEVAISDMVFDREIGHGANAVVFAAIDTQLDRPVAVKIWNARGISRSKEETVKIANIHHPLFVTTHRFGKIENQPFAIMELVVGTSAKEWLTGNPPLKSRIRVWQLFSRAMSHLYKTKIVHGDPHTGNILIFIDAHGAYTDSVSLDEENVAVKIADVGTSAFWSSPREFERRERRLLVETASRLFHDQNINSLLQLSPRLPHYIVLKALDGFCEYVEIASTEDEPGRKASAIADTVLKVPFFRLTELVDEIRRTPSSLGRRVKSRINASLRNIQNVLDADNDHINVESVASYAASRRLFIQRCREKYETEGGNRAATL